MWQIPISDGTDLYNKYVFTPVKVSAASYVVFDEVQEFEPAIDVYAVHAEKFLFYFLKKHFDPDLEFNRKRITNWRNNDYKCVFEETQADNFYTYETIKAIIFDLENTADLLEKDFENATLESIVTTFDVRYMCDPNSNNWATEEFGEIKGHINVVCNFYRRLAKHLSHMMEINPNADLINFEYGY